MAGRLPGALDEEGLLKLSEYSLVTSLRHWTVFAERGLGFVFRSRASESSSEDSASARLLPSIVRIRAIGPA